MNLDRFDHLVLTVRDLQATCSFYTRVLGMREQTFEGNRKALLFAEQKINLHEAGHEFEPKAQHPTPGSADLCFITSVSIEQVIEHMHACNVAILEGPVQRTGANGAMMSVYFRDPDGNLLEVSHYL